MYANEFSQTKYRCFPPRSPAANLCLRREKKSNILQLERMKAMTATSLYPSICTKTCNDHVVPQSAQTQIQLSSLPIGHGYVRMCWLPKPHITYKERKEEKNPHDSTMIVSSHKQTYRILTCSRAPFEYRSHLTESGMLHMYLV